LHASIHPQPLRTAKETGRRASLRCLRHPPRPPLRRYARSAATASSILPRCSASPSSTRHRPLAAPPRLAGSIVSTHDLRWRCTAATRRTCPLRTELAMIRTTRYMLLSLLLEARQASASLAGQALGANSRHRAARRAWRPPPPHGSQEGRPDSCLSRGPRRCGPTRAALVSQAGREVTQAGQWDRRRQRPWRRRIPSRAASSRA